VDMNLMQAISVLYPAAVLLQDYELRDDGDGVYIDVWRLKDTDGNDVPRPTEEELEAAWEAYVPPEPPESLPDKVERLEQETVTTMIAVTEAYETSLQQSAEREQETVTAMIGLAEAYELITTQQAHIDSLTARIEALEGGEE